jgi:hypothetical protein
MEECFGGRTGIGSGTGSGIRIENGAGEAKPSEATWGRGGGRGAARSLSSAFWGRGGLWLGLGPGLEASGRGAPGPAHCIQVVCRVDWTLDVPVSSSLCLSTVQLTLWLLCPRTAPSLCTWVPTYLGRYLGRYLWFECVLQTLRDGRDSQHMAPAVLDHLLFSSQMRTLQQSTPTTLACMHMQDRNKPPRQLQAGGA